MTGYALIIPPELLDPKRKDEFIAWLVALPLDIWTKKYIALSWSQITGVTLTREMIEIITLGKDYLTRDKG